MATPLRPLLPFRRVFPDYWDENEIELDNIEFPDMSVTRGSLGPPTCARWNGEEYCNWGVIGFKVGDIPPKIPYLGAVIYRLRAVHKPLKKNYPHSEVQAFEAKWDDPSAEIHLDKNTLQGVPLEAQLEWREILLRSCKVVLRPREEPATPA
jgi:hypothetical protein